MSCHLNISQRKNLKLKKFNRFLSKLEDIKIKNY